MSDEKALNRKSIDAATTLTGAAISADDLYTVTTAGNYTISGINYVYPNSRNLASLGNVLTLLPIHIIKKCLVEMDHIYAISNSTNLDLALSITEENKEATLKMLKLRGW